MESIKKYVITYVYKNIKMDFNIKAESEEELKEYIKKVNKIIEDYNNKYNTNFSLFD